MTSKIELKLSTFSGKKFSLLRFQTPPEDLFTTKNATIQEVPMLEVEDDDVKPDSYHMTDQQKKEYKKKTELKKKLEAQTLTILTIENNGKKKEYICRPESEALSQSGYYIMRQDHNWMTLTPVDCWYNVQLGGRNSKITMEEAENEFANIDRRPLGSKFKKIAEVLDQNSECPTEKKSNAPADDQYESENKKSDTERRALLRDAEEQDRLFGGHLYARLSDSESDESELNEKGKELKKIMKKNAGELEELDVSDTESDQESDIDALEKKYSQTEILHDLPFDIQIPPESSLNASTQRSGLKANNAPVQNIPTLPPKSQLPLAVSVKEREIVKVPTVRTQVGQKDQALEKLIEEKMLKYLERQSMSTALLLKKLLIHAPPGCTKEQIVLAMANIIKRLGIQKRTISGQTYLDTKKNLR